MKIRTVPSKLTHEQLQAYLGRISWTGDVPEVTLSCLCGFSDQAECVRRR